MRAVYLKTTYVLDRNNDLPNVYSWTQASRRFIMMTGSVPRANAPIPTRDPEAPNGMSPPSAARWRSSTRRVVDRLSTHVN